MDLVVVAFIVVSGSTAAVAALFAILTYLHDKDKAVLEADSRWLLYSGLITLGLAVTSGLLSLRPRSALLPAPEDLDLYLSENSFYNPADYSQRQLGLAQLAELRSLDKANTRMAKELLFGQVLQLIGFLCLAGAIFILW